jgi:hypothetical protein
MSRLTDLNALFDSELGGFPEALDRLELPSTTPSNDTRNDIKIKPRLWQTFEKMIEKFNKGLSNHRIELVRPILWRCTYLFPNGNVCDTVNGFMAGTKVVRKTCNKCRRPRSNKLTLDQEITIEHLREEIMDFDDCSYSEAVTKLNEASIKE